MHKSENLKQLALSHGWKAEVVPDLDEFDISGDPADIQYKLYAIREQPELEETENLKVVWTGNLQTECLYTFGDYSQAPARKAGVIALLTGTPTVKRMKKAKPEQFIPEQPEYGVPWEPDSPAMDIMLAVINRKIIWISKMTGTEKSAYVDVNLQEQGSARNFRVYDAPSGRRILEWADAIGFHCVAIEEIVNVV